MKILFVTQVLPNDNGSGTQRRAAQHLRALATLGDVTAVLHDAASSDPQAIPRARSLGASEVIIREEASRAQQVVYKRLAAQSPLKRAYHSFRLRPYHDGAALDEAKPRYLPLLAEKFELVFAFRIQSALWIESIAGASYANGRRAIVDFDDIESIAFAGKAVDAPRFRAFWRWKKRQHLAWLKRAEAGIARRWPVAMLCSALDARRFEAMTGRAVAVVPNAVPFDRPPPEEHRDAVDLLFVGTFSYQPNARGALWFAVNVWDDVRARLKGNATLTLVGFHPGPEIVALGERPGVTVIGDAPDLAPHYARANIVIAPIFAGSGTRIKIIEAAAKGRAIVTTAIGCEGLDFEAGVHAEIADTPAAFADAVGRLARDPARRRALADAARAHCEARFSTEAVETVFREHIRTAVEARA